jgi:hypothetical protein
LKTLEGFALGELSEPATVRVRFGDGPPTIAELTAVNRSFRLAVVGKASRKEAVTQQEASLVGQAEAPQDSFKISFHKSRFSDWRARLSVLRAAYLVGFAVTGYWYLGIWTPIREQIRTPSEERLRRLVQYDRTQPNGRRLLALIQSPADCRCLVVGFDRWTAFLPLSRESRLWNPVLTEQTVEFSGSELSAWPVEPSFGRGQNTSLLPG